VSNLHQAHKNKNSHAAAAFNSGVSTLGHLTSYKNSLDTHPSLEKASILQDGNIINSHKTENLY